MRYGASHAIAITPGGVLEKILGKRETMVNSIHRQGVRKLGPGLVAEATAPDGIIEAVSVIFQVVSFKSRGKRIFLMAPIHHHFEMKGWEEPKVVVRLWIIAILLALLSLSTLKLR